MELVITMVVAGVLMAAAFTILNSQIALFTVQGAKLETQVSLRTGAGMLSWAFQEASATGGDVTAIGTNSITLRAVHAAGIVCSQNAQWFGIYDVSGQFVAADSVLAYNMEGERWGLTPPLNSVDRTPTGLATNAPDCFWGDTTNAPNPEVALDWGTTSSLLDSVLVGAPVRAFHPVRFSLEEVGGRYWLVQRISGATDPERVAGPLLSPADSGLVFHYYDVNGDETATPADVATVEILLKSESREDLSAYLTSGNLADTLRLRVSLRNN